MSEQNTNPVAVPHGYALVPVNPTPEMLDAGNRARLYREHGSLDDAEVCGRRTYNSLQAYAAMLAAAPQAPSREPLTAATEAVVREKARIHFQEGHSWRGCWNPDVELVTQLAETFYRVGWEDAEKFYGITKEGGAA